MQQIHPGDLVECVDKAGHISELTRGRTYVVIDVTEHAGHCYIRVVADDERPHRYLSGMFVVTAEGAVSLAIAAERERCARIVEGATVLDSSVDQALATIAAGIRAGV